MVVLVVFPAPFGAAEGNPTGISIAVFFSKQRVLHTLLCESASTEIVPYLSIRHRSIINGG